MKLRSLVILAVLGWGIASGVAVILAAPRLLPPGPPGIAGDRGLAGQPAKDGSTGPQGVVGKTGPKGPRGDTGPKGASACVPPWEPGAPQFTSRAVCVAALGPSADPYCDLPGWVTRNPCT
jgi:hypothetical protein